MGLPVHALLASGLLLLLAEARAQTLPQFGQPRLESSTCQGALPAHTTEGRGKVKKKGRVLLSLLLGVKMLALSVAVPLIVALALYSAWKGVTISLLAFMIASIVGLKSLLGKAHDQNVIVAKVPAGGGQEQWWRRLDLASLDPYRGYNPLSALQSLQPI